MQLIGHRGARREAPENTLGGFAHLRSLGIQRVELDLHLTHDNQLVVNHDATTQRTTLQTGTISQLSAAALAGYNAAAQFKDWPHVEPIPTLDQVLSEWPELESIQLEVKTANHYRIPAITQQLARTIEAHDLGERATVTSIDVRILAHMREYFPKIQRGYVAERFVRDPLATCHRLRCKFLVMDYRGLRADLVKNAHAAGMHVSTWTVNDLASARRMQALGVDSLISDCPTLMLQAFEAQ
ncbi:Glycerophosphoryl diester phosphodiesterase [gamma proteobacterium HdN1]|nr:Glycerophosphoryl diester phosphodiesterase [gamma proteobacterium HdN1]